MAMNTIHRVPVVWVGAVLTLTTLLRSSTTGEMQDDSVLYDEEMQVVSAKPMPFPALGMSRQPRVVVVVVTLGDEGGVEAARAISGGRHFVEAALENVKSWTFRPNPKRRAVVIYRFEREAGRCVSGSGVFSRGGNVAKVTTCEPEAMP
jgi:outer membrane biosynthesis protein TonB